MTRRLVCAVATAAGLVALFHRAHAAAWSAIERALTDYRSEVPDYVPL